MNRVFLLARGELNEWLNKRRLGKGGDWRTILLNVIIGALLVTVAVFIFVKIGSEFRSYPGVLEGLLCLYLFVVFAINALMTAIGLKHSLFESHTSKLPLSWPVSKLDIMLGKSLAAWLKSLPLTFVMSYPIWVTYSIVAQKPFYIYFVALLYPLLISFVEIAVGYLLVVPMQGLHLIARRSVVMQIVFGSICAVAVAFLYSQFLNLFVKIIIYGDLNGMAEIYNLSITNGWAAYLIPVSFLVKLMVSASWANLGFYFGCLFAILAVGLLIAYPSYFKIVNEGKSGDVNKNWKVPSSSTSALFLKELSLLFRGKGGASEIVALFVGYPVICYAAVAATNLVFTQGNLRYVTIYFPMFMISFTGMFVFMGAAAVSTSSMDTITREGKKLELMKLCPIPLAKQLFIKECVPYIMPAISYLCAMVVLRSTDLINWTDFAWLTVMGLVFLVFVACYGTMAETKAVARGKKSVGLWDSLVPFIIPIVIFGCIIGLSFLLASQFANATLRPVCYNCILAGFLLILIGLSIYAAFHTIRKGPQVIEAGKLAEDEE